jgi:hypothetical protein
MNVILRGNDLELGYQVELTMMLLRGGLSENGPRWRSLGTNQRAILTLVLITLSNAMGLVGADMIIGRGIGPKGYCTLVR